MHSPSRPSLAKTTRMESDIQYSDTVLIKKDTALLCDVCQTSTDKYFESFSHVYQYMCPHSSDGWHRQVVLLRHEKQKTYSVTIRDILEKEIMAVLETREATVEI